jgi:hypothetical protein
MSDLSKEFQKNTDKYKGYGYILLYNFNEEFVRLETFLPEVLKNNYCGGLGAVIYLNYSESPTGPYEELLFIPGKFCYRGEKNHIVSKSMVSTSNVTKNRLGKWYTPKEKVTFSHETLGKQTENVTVSMNGEDFASFELKSGKFKFRIKTSKRLSFSLMELDGDTPVKINYSSKITAKFSKLESIKIRPAFFPDIAKFNPLCIFKLQNVTLHFATHETTKTGKNNEFPL